MPAEVVDRDNMRMLQLAVDLGLLDHAIAGERVSGTFRFDHFQGDDAVELAVGRVIDASQAPFGDDLAARVSRARGVRRRGTWRWGRSLGGGEFIDRLGHSGVAY